MTGDWGGLRTQLEDKGINWQTWLTAEPVRNFNGYKGVTTAWADTLAWGADVDLGKLTREVVSDFREQTSGRNIIWEILPLPVVKADRALLQGFNTYAGHVTCEPVAQAHNLEYVPAAKLLG